MRQTNPNPVLDAIARRRELADEERRLRASVAQEATRLRVDCGLGWEEIAKELGYSSAQAATHAANRYGGFDSRRVKGRCKICGKAVKRRGRSGRLPEACSKHQAEVARRRELARREARPSRLCVDCGAELGPEWPIRCPVCAKRRRRERERARERTPKRIKAKSQHKTARGYTSTNWKRVSAAAIARAGACEDCGSADDLTGHLPAGGDHRTASVDDVVVLCRSCHGGRGDRPKSAPPEDARRRRPRRKLRST